MYQSLLLVLHIPLVHTHPHTTQPMGQRYRYKMSRLLSIYYPPCHWEFVPNREGGKPIVDRIVRPSELIRMISPWFPDCGIWRLFGWIFALDSSWSWIVVPVPVHVLIPIRGQDREWYLVWQWIVSMSLTDYSHRFSWVNILDLHLWRVWRVVQLIIIPWHSRNKRKKMNPVMRMLWSSKKFWRLRVRVLVDLVKLWRRVRII